jgi:glycosyltransferase involved in cell wall biosynthesis
MKPEVSIIMPVLNGERYIRQSIESIAAQTYRDYELVVIDDGSTDRTREIVESFRGRMTIRYIHHAQNQGIARSMNDGVRASQGEYITFLDHDDIWFPRMLATQVGYLNTHPEVAMVHSDFQTIDGAGGILESSVAVCRGRKRASGQVFRELFQESQVCGITVVVRKSVVDQMRGFDERLHWGDYHLWLRIALRYPIGFTPEVLAQYRQHSSQSTRTYETDRPDRDSVALQAIRLLLEEHPEAARKLGRRAIRRRMASLYYEMAYAWLWQGRHAYARACLRRALVWTPGNRGYWASYFASFLNPTQAAKLRHAWHAFRAHAGERPGAAA